MMVRTSAGIVECTPLIRAASGLVECGNAMFRTASGVVSIGSVRALSATASPSDAYGATDAPGSPNVSTNAVTVTASGGRAPYTYSWAKTDGDTIAASAPSSATTAFVGSVPRNDSRQATFECTVTDAAGHSATSNAVFAIITNYGDSGGIL